MRWSAGEARRSACALPRSCSSPIHPVPGAAPAHRRRGRARRISSSASSAVPADRGGERRASSASCTTSECALLDYAAPVSQAEHLVGGEPCFSASTSTSAPPWSSRSSARDRARGALPSRAGRRPRLPERAPRRRDPSPLPHRPDLRRLGGDDRSRHLSAPRVAENALSTIVRGAGSQFDAGLATRFVDMMRSAVR